MSGITHRDNGTWSVGQLNVIGTHVKVKTIDITASTGEQDTLWDLPATAIVHEVMLNVTTAEVTGTTKTLDIGLLSTETGGDANGFAVGLSTAATGLVRPQATVTAGGTETYFASTTKGVLMTTFLAGADVATDVGTCYEFPHLSDAVVAKSISWTPGSAQTEFAGQLIILYTDIV